MVSISKAPASTRKYSKHKAANQLSYPRKNISEILRGDDTEQLVGCEMPTAQKRVETSRRAEGQHFCHYGDIPEYPG